MMLSVCCQLKTTTMKCKVAGCYARCRLDGSCSSSSCSLYRKSKRSLLNNWVRKAKAFLKTPSPESVKNKRLRKRLVVKQRPPHSPPADAILSDFASPAALESSAAAGSPEESHYNVINITASSSSASIDEEREAIKDAIMEDNGLVPEDHFSTLRNFFEFGSMTEPGSEGTLQGMVARVASVYPKVCSEVGEPRALAVYSNISGILQKLPQHSLFLPSRVYVAALFYLAWEMAGSWDGDSVGPAIIRSAPQKDVVAGVCTLMNLMNNKS